MNKGANNSYIGNIKETIHSLLLGMKLSIRHFFEARKSRTAHAIHEPNYFHQKTGIFTLQYPKDSIPVPDIGRYRLHNEIDDCIVCDKCAKICPVDCIEIEPIKAVEEFGRTSDDTPKRIYAAKFDIDMGKCCFCGLCTTVCPTECLTMTKSYDFSEFDVADHIYAFAEMTPLQILEKKQELEKATQEKELAKAVKASEAAELDNQGAVSDTAQKSEGQKPSFKPRMPMKPKTSTGASEQSPKEEAQNQALELMKAKAQKEEAAKDQGNTPQDPVEKTSRPVFKPKVPMKPKVVPKENEEKTDAKNLENESKADQSETFKQDDLKEENKAKPSKPVFKPRIPIKKNKPDG